MSDASFRTKIKTALGSFKVGHENKIMTIGSCFSDSMGSQLARFKFDVLANPFGTMYNPMSIFKLLSEEAIDETKFVNNGGLFFHHDFHSSFRHKSKEELLQSLQSAKQFALETLSTANVLVVTFGTAWVYESQAGAIVNNCHKVPQKQFNKRLLGMKEMAVAMDEVIVSLKALNPNLNILLTVSPVRHTKDGLPENQLSKSMLRVLCDFAVTSHQSVAYFPSYEIMMDDLRDYRFYKDDLIHPTSFAEQYIWEQFQNAYFLPETNQFIQGWQSILSAMEHRPLNPKSVEHQQFIHAQLSKLHELSIKVDTNKEIDFFQRQLI